MFFISSLLVFILIQAELILSTKFNVWPEMVTLPWLIGKGLIPYRDFFDHHGFLLYYLIAPFVKDHSFLSLKLFFLVVQSINLALILLIIKKSKNKTAFLLGGILFIFLNYFVSVNLLWYEELIATFLLAAYYISQKTIRSSGSYIIKGILIALASFIKPTAAVFIIPIMLYSESLIPFFSLILSWLFVFGIYAVLGSLPTLFSDLFFFNSYLARHYHNPYYSDFRFHLSLALISLILLLAGWKTKTLRKIIYPFTWMLFSLIFVFYLYSRPHMVPFISFFTIFFAEAISSAKRTYQPILTLLLIIYLLFLGKKVIYEKQYINAQTPWQEQSFVKQGAEYLKKNNLARRKFYVFSNHGELYVFFDQLPPTTYPLLFPLMNRYIPDFEMRIIRELQKNKVSVIIVPKPLEEPHVRLSKIKSYILQNYSLVEDADMFRVYISRKPFLRRKMK